VTTLSSGSQLPARADNNLSLDPVVLFSSRSLSSFVYRRHQRLNGDRITSDDRALYLAANQSCRLEIFSFSN